MLNKLLKYVLPVAAVLMVSLPAVADTLSDSRASGTIRVGTGAMGIKPLLWKGSDGGYEGAEAELTKELVNRIGIKNFEFVVSEWSTLIPGLNSNRWDLLLTGMAKTEERIQNGGIAMSNPYMMIYDLIVVNKGSDIRSEADLKGKKIGAVLGTVDSLVAHAIVERGGAAEVKDFNTYAEPFMALGNKQVDAVLVDQLAYVGFKSKMPDIEVVGEPLAYMAKPQWVEAQSKVDYNLGAVAVGVRKADESLLKAVNEALDAMEADGTRKKILEKYGIWNERQTREAMMK